MNKETPSKKVKNFRIITFVAFFIGYLIPILDKKTNNDFYSLFNNFTYTNFLISYLVYFLFALLLIFLLRRKVEKNLLIKELPKKTDIFFTQIDLFLLGYFSGIMTVVGNVLIRLTIPA